MDAMVFSNNRHSKPFYVLLKPSTAKYHGSTSRYVTTNYAIIEIRLIIIISVLLALDGWLKNNNKTFILFSGAAIVMFRSELALFAGILLLYDLYYKRITVKR